MGRVSCYCALAAVEEFLSLTDHLPVSTVQEVYRTIQRTFHQAPKDGERAPALWVDRV